MTLQAGKRIGNYQIIASLGSGGMGEVYRAKDLRLLRDVALKVLPTHLVSDAERLARLEREARAVAALNHPNIVVLYSVEDVDDIRFLTMELIEGASLDHVVTPGGLPVPRVLDLGIELADALVAAHEKGIVHRDLKPGNVMLTPDGRVKVLDFGLAKLVDQGPEDDVTRAATGVVTEQGALVGTLVYMSPEQLRGETVDARSDLFTLGVILYELAVGHRPFRGTSRAEVTSAILRDEPPPLAHTRGDLPSELVRIVGRCLEKSADRRIQTARDVRNELDQIRRGVSSGSARSETSATRGFGSRPAIAVLPFENRSGDPEQEYFADGLAEDLISRLSLWRAFPVIARNSSFTYKGKVVDVREVANGLGVRYVVQGSVRKSGNRVRIAAQLVDATTGQNVLAQTYDRELIDVFAVQDEISEAIAVSLVVDLQHAEYTHVQHRMPESLEAWGLYQRALGIFYRFTRDDSRKARAMLERATQLEPGFSTAWARLSEVGIWEYLYLWTDAPEQTLETALKQAQHAVELDPRDPEAHADLSFALMTCGEGDAALVEAARAVELNPSHTMALLFYAYMRNMTGHDAGQSIELVHRAMRLSPRDPLEWLSYDVFASAYFNAGRFQEGLKAAQRLIVLRPDYYFGQIWAAMNAVGLGDLETANTAILEARRLVPELSLATVRRVLGAMAPHVEQRMMGALEQAGLT